MNIHPTAVIDADAEIDATVKIGAYTVIEKGAVIGAQTEIGPHTVISGFTAIGQRNRIGSFATIGPPPQDLTYKNEPTRVEIGDDNLIREYVSIHRGTAHGRQLTSIGNGNMIMAYSHIAHDCRVGSHVIMANCATLGGHVQIDDHANLGGMVAIHQFSRIGCHAYIGGMSGISKDVPPFVIVSGIRNKLRITGINRVGLQRCGYDKETIRLVHNAFVYIFRTPGLLLKEALAKSADEFADCEPVMTMINFFKAPNRMGVLRRVDDE
ncbi:MAG: acyl-ACP--UDP-N-acetylglucosamine O-acyltransferase [Deltaproteobacteria bacterium]|nr:acyl-ACP--UDP-N-acetylglucosamine O-acyltransferase [Deltaproteobacteria bacterium]